MPQRGECGRKQVQSGGLEGADAKTAGPFLTKDREGLLGSDRLCMDAMTMVGQHETSWGQ
jgi:hypothetical protein